MTRGRMSYIVWLMGGPHFGCYFFFSLQGSMMHWQWKVIGKNVILLTHFAVTYTRVLIYQILYVCLFPQFRHSLKNTFLCRIGKDWKSKRYELDSKRPSVSSVLMETYASFHYNWSLSKKKKTHQVQRLGTVFVF